MKLILIANLVFISNFFSRNTEAFDDSTGASTPSSCNFTSTEYGTITVLALINDPIDVPTQTLMGFAYSNYNFSDYIKPLLTTGSAQHVYVETGKAINAINNCYAKLPGYNYTWKGIGDDGAIIARVAAEESRFSNFPTLATSFQKTFQIMDNTTLVEFEVDGVFVTVANGEVQDIQFNGTLTKHLAPSPEVVSFQGYLYVYVSESGSLINFEGAVQVCNGTTSKKVGVSGNLTYDFVPPNQGFVDPAGVESFLVLPDIPPTVNVEVTYGNKINMFVGNDGKSPDAAPIVGFANADPKFQAYFNSLSLGTGSEITVSTNEAYNLLSNCNIITSK